MKKYRYQDAECLLDQAADLLDRGIKDRAQWQDLYEKWLRNALEVRDSGNVTFSTPSRKVDDDLVMATAMEVWMAWEVHGQYLQVDGPVPLVSNSGLMQGGHPSPLFELDLVGQGPRYWDRF